MSKPNHIISHWSTMIEGLEASPMEFFEAVEKAITNKQMENIKFWRSTWSEGGIMSAKREYLRVRRKDLAYDICGAPFGNGFFVSTWLGDHELGLVAKLFSIPILGPMLERMFKPQTYYRYDTAGMFQSLVHSAVLEVIDTMTNAKGLRALPETERKPEMRNFFD